MNSEKEPLTLVMRDGKLVDLEKWLKTQTDIDPARVAEFNKIKQVFPRNDGRLSVHGLVFVGDKVILDFQQETNRDKSWVTGIESYCKDQSVEDSFDMMLAKIHSRFRVYTESPRWIKECKFVEEVVGGKNGFVALSVLYSLDLTPEECTRVEGVDWSELCKPSDRRYMCLFTLDQIHEFDMHKLMAKEVYEVILKRLKLNDNNSPDK